jgi:two-component system, NarL family, response regulator LiaR
VVVSEKVRLLVAAPAPVRLGIRVALGNAVEICADAETAEQAIRAAKREQPNACLIAWNLAGGGRTAVRGVTRAVPQTSTVVLADEITADAMLEAVRAGAVGYVPSTTSIEQLHRIIAAIGANEAVLPRNLIRELLLEVRSSGGGTDGLTGREVQILGMLRRGHSTATIASRLDIAPVTVRRHISGLVRKLGVESRAELVDLSQDRTVVW